MSYSVDCFVDLFGYFVGFVNCFAGQPVFAQHFGYFAEKSFEQSVDYPVACCYLDLPGQLPVDLLWIDLAGYFDWLADQYPRGRRLGARSRELNR